MNDAAILAPKVLYGTLSHAGRGWKQAAKAAWENGWVRALRGVECIDLVKADGPILLGDRPSGIMDVDHFRTHPFWAMYCVHSTMTQLAHDLRYPGKGPPEKIAVYNRLRDLVLEGLDRPWYAMSTFWPETAFIPPYDDCFPDEEAWKAEQKRVAGIALEKIVRHFPIFERLEGRFTRDGGLGPVPLGKMRIVGVLYHCGVLGMGERDGMELLSLPPLHAEKKLLDWMDNQGLSVGG